MKENYDAEMYRIMDETPKGEKLLLHCCCAPCSTTCLEILKERFSVTALFYNPNIDDAVEYEKRKKELIRFLGETGWGNYLDCDYEKEAFEKIAVGLEQEPERGKRCYLCYDLRLSFTAKTAKEKGYKFFATTLTLSRFKNAEWLNGLGEKAGQKFDVKYLPSDFKKHGGELRSKELSAQYELYRQNYCGCRFSRR